MLCALAKSQSLGPFFFFSNRPVNGQRISSAQKTRPEGRPLLLDRSISFRSYLWRFCILSHAIFSDHLPAQTNRCAHLSSFSSYLAMIVVICGVMSCRGMAGELVRETTKDTEAIAQYKSMRETLVYLTHLNNDDTETIMLEKLSKQVEVS